MKGEPTATLSPLHGERDPAAVYLSVWGQLPPPPPLPPLTQPPSTCDSSMWCVSLRAAWGSLFFETWGGTGTSTTCRPSNAISDVPRPLCTGAQSSKRPEDQQGGKQGLCTEA
jgi:hypothetical protein